MTNPDRSTFDVLVGRWEGNAIVHPNPWGGAGPARTSWHFRWDAASLFLLCDCRQIRADGSIFSAHGVLGVDPEQGDALWWWFDSYGFPPLDPARGRWDGNTLLLAKSTVRGTGRTSFHASGDVLECTIDARPVGQTDFAAVMSGSFLRA
ncbi:hypothetical protein [Luteibacter sp. CQ10]|uniref:hypothetical protein n=1 Tax=Luteibacter sp. CQ10 TaxID=2805821 RepID=UPI0034A0F9F8